MISLTLHFDLRFFKWTSFLNIEFRNQIAGSFKGFYILFDGIPG
jgi:hypothetical protein